MATVRTWDELCSPRGSADPRVIGWLGTALIVGALVITAVAGITALLRRGPHRLALAVVALVEVLLVIQAVVAVVASIGGKAADEPGLFFAYLVAVVLILPAAWLLARTEPNKSGSLILVVGGLVLAVLVVRLQQLWGVSIG